MSKVITKKEFHDWFVTPIEQHFNIKCYWNGKKVEEVGLNQLKSNLAGICYTSKYDTPIIIKYFKDRSVSMFRTLIHEYAHAKLHVIGTVGNSFSCNIKEIEAETVAKLVFLELKMDYTNYTYYIRKYEKKCSRQELLGYYEREDRKVLINKLVEEIIGIYKPMNKKLSYLSYKPKLKNNHNGYKYEISCPCCNQVWKYKKSNAKIVKSKGMGFYCKKCGREKTLNKLGYKEVK